MIGFDEFCSSLGVHYYSDWNGSMEVAWTESQDDIEAFSSLAKEEGFYLGSPFQELDGSWCVRLYGLKE